MPLGSAAFAAWDVWRRGSWPFDDWLSAPLVLLVQMTAIDMVYNTKQFMKTKDADWSKLTKTQTDLIKWLSQ
jgi:hypothetical protein